MNKKIHLLFGVGEVGTALKKILQKSTDLYWFDLNPKIENHLPSELAKVDVLHITFPQNDQFVTEVKKLIKKYKPELTVIHSTTIPGTTKKFGQDTIHSPILGQHDNLYHHIITFKKAIGPNSLSAREKAKKYLKQIFKLEFYKDATTTEAAKVLSLAKFAINIEMARYSSEVCKKLKIDFDETNIKFMKLYNEGYQASRLDKFTQPLLTPPKKCIGGTCVIPGVSKAQIVLESSLLNEILKKNHKSN